MLVPIQKACTLYSEDGEQVSVALIVRACNEDANGKEKNKNKKFENKKKTRKYTIVTNGVASGS